MQKEGQSRESYELEYYERTGGGETADQIIKTLEPEISAIKGKVSFNRKRQRYMWACMVMNTVLLLVILVFLGIQTLLLYKNVNSGTGITVKNEPATEKEPCALQLFGVSHKFLRLTDTSATYNITVSGVNGSGLAQCELRFLAVGGGGRYPGSNGGGAGSGYLKYRTVNVASGTVIDIDVGDEAQPTSVDISNLETFVARPGQDGQGRDKGGRGYSGGGGQGKSGDKKPTGGTNGGDGLDGNNSGARGGTGTGENIYTYTFNKWSLAAGEGGQDYEGWGAGGGGVLVDGVGPPASVYQGQGFGGGASGFKTAGTNYGAGLPGVVLVEITSM